MPGSRVQGKQEIKDWVYGHDDIDHIVDVGPGSATYSKLLGKDYDYVGIEIWAPYIVQWNLKKYYKKVIVADVRHVKFPPGDLIIFGDILEHLEKIDAEEVLWKALELYPHVVVSVPLSDKRGEVTYGQEHYGNWFESHKAGWTFEEFSKLAKWDMAKIINKNKIGVFAK